MVTGGSGNGCLKAGVATTGGSGGGGGGGGGGLIIVGRGVMIGGLSITGGGGGGNGTGNGKGSATIGGLTTGGTGGGKFTTGGGGEGIGIFAGSPLPPPSNASIPTGAAAGVGTGCVGAEEKGYRPSKLPLEATNPLGPVGSAAAASSSYPTSPGATALANIPPIPRSLSPRPISGSGTTGTGLVLTGRTTGSGAGKLTGGSIMLSNIPVIFISGSNAPICIIGESIAGVGATGTGAATGAAIGATTGIVGKKVPLSGSNDPGLKGGVVNLSLGLEVSVCIEDVVCVS